MPKLFEGTDLTKAARLWLGFVAEDEGEDGEGRWKPMLRAALTMRSFRQVRWGSSMWEEVVGLMIVEVEEVVRAEEWV